MRDVHLYPDGSCLDNGLPSARGGWSCLVVSGGVVIDSTILGKLREGKQTNNRAEMEAFLQALLWIDSNDIKDVVHIHCDSDVVIGGVTGSSQRNANRDIWEQIEKMCSKLLGRFTINYCAGHVDEFNVLADRLAKQAANSLILAPIKVAI